jgi:predicted ABC-type ATPase
MTTPIANNKPNAAEIAVKIEVIKKLISDHSLTDSQKVDLSLVLEKAQAKLQQAQAQEAAAMQCPPMDEAGNRLITPEAIERLRACIEKEPDTKSLHTNDKGEYSAERKKLHDAIRNEVLNQKCVEQNRPIAILMGGIPGSGKSTWLEKNMQWVKNAFVKVDADEIRAKLPEYKGWNAGKTQKETRDIVSSIINSIAGNCDYDVVYDSTMTNLSTFTTLLKTLKDNNYIIFVVYVDISADIAKERALKRYTRSGRYVDANVIDSKNNTEVFDKIKLSADGYLLIDGITGKQKEKGGMGIPPNRDFAYINQSTEKVTKQDIAKIEEKEQKAGELIAVPKAECNCKEQVAAETDVAISNIEVEPKQAIAEKTEIEPQVEVVTALPDEQPIANTDTIPAKDNEQVEAKKKEVMPKDVIPLTDEATYPVAKPQSEAISTSVKTQSSFFGGIINSVDNIVNGSPTEQAINQVKETIKSVKQPKKAAKKYPLAKEGQYAENTPLTADKKTLKGYEKADVFLVPLSDISVNTELFQNRKEKFSKRTFGNLEQAYQKGEFLLEVLDPILLYRMPDTGVLYTINHSRFAWFQHALKNGYKLPDGFNFKNIPAKIIDGNKVSLEQIIRIAQNSNNLGTPETILERVAEYQYRLSQPNADREEIRNSIKSIEAYNAKLIGSYINLDPNGKAMAILAQMENGQIESETNARNITYIVGKIRERFPQLTKQHEDELTDWLVNGGYGIGAKQVASLTEAAQKVQALVEKNTSSKVFDAQKPLNPKQLITKAFAVQEWEKELKAATAILKDAEKQLIKKGIEIVQAQAQDKKNANKSDAEKEQQTKEAYDKQYNQAIANERKAVSNAIIDLRNILLRKENVVATGKREISLFEKTTDDSESEKPNAEKKTEVANGEPKNSNIATIGINLNTIARTDLYPTNDPDVFDFGSKNDGDKNLSVKIGQIRVGAGQELLFNFRLFNKKNEIYRFPNYVTHNSSVRYGIKTFKEINDLLEDASLKGYMYIVDNDTIRDGKLVWGVNRRGEILKEGDKLMYDNGQPKGKVHIKVEFDREQGRWNNEQHYSTYELVGTYDDENKGAIITDDETESEQYEKMLLHVFRPEYVKSMADLLAGITEMPEEDDFFDMVYDRHQDATKDEVRKAYEILNVSLLEKKRLAENIVAKPFTYLGDKFTAVRYFSAEELAFGSPLFIDKEYIFEGNREFNYDDFYKIAKENNADLDIFAIEGNNNPKHWLDMSDNRKLYVPAGRFLFELGVPDDFEDFKKNNIEKYDKYLLIEQQASKVFGKANEDKISRVGKAERKKPKAKLRATSPTIDGLTKLINKYFYSTSFKIHPDLTITNSRGVVQNFFVKNERGRYRLYEIIENS